MEFEPQNFIPVVESDDFIGSVAVAETTDDQAELNMDVLLGGTLDVDAFVKRVAEPSRVRVDFSKLSDDSDSFDASDNIIDALDTPDVPTYTPPPQRVEKRQSASPVVIYAKGYRPPTKRLKAPDGIHVGENTARKVVSEDGRFVCEYDSEGELLREYEMVEVED
jgi:hypothetical protein